MYQFSSGSLYGYLPQNVSNPRKFGQLQDVSVDISFNKKALYGQNQFPVTIARGQGKITGKAKFANLNGLMLNDLFFGQASPSTGQVMPIFGEAGTISGGSFQVTVANGATFRDDLGVTYSATGLRLVRVGSAPAVGQYSVSGLGVYQFAAGDTGLGVVIDYTYTISASGSTLSLNQLLSGSTPTFGMVLVSKYQAPGQAVLPLYLNLFVCTSEKLSLATKMDDFMVPEFDFEAMANVSNQVGTLALGE